MPGKSFNRQRFKSNESFINWIVLILVLLFFSDCSAKKEKRKEHQVFSSDQLVEVNKYLVKKDQQTIRSYVARQGWKMETSATGLWYGEIQPGKEIPVEKGEYVTLNYSLSLLDGKICYSSDSSGFKQFLVGHGGVEAGLEEGILFFHEGDSGRIILPPHLGYGLLGDENKIPGRAILLYHFKILKISDRP